MTKARTRTRVIAYDKGDKDKKIANDKDDDGDENGRQQRREQEQGQLSTTRKEKVINDEGGDKDKDVCQRGRRSIRSSSPIKDYRQQR